MLPLQAHSHRFFNPEHSIDTIMPDKVLRQQRGDVLPWVIGGAVAAVAIGAVIYLATTPPPSQKKQYYTVTVEVIDATTGNPVNGATVSLDSFTSQTDSTGVAVLTNVPAGTYLLTVMASGYQQYISSEVISGDTAIPVQLASTTTQPPPTSITPVARVVDPATGAYLTSDTIQVVQEMKVSTQVPSSTQPVSVQAFINGKGASVHPWDVSATGYNYIIDFGPAPNMPGNYTVYTQVTFADGSTANSNTVLITIAPASAPPPPTPTPSFYYVKFEITDAYSGAPISNAKITMTSSSTGTTYTGYTDANGTYTFNNLPADTYYVNVSAANYQPDSFPLTVNSNMTFPLGLSTYPPVRGGPYPT